LFYTYHSSAIQYADRRTLITCDERRYTVLTERELLKRATDYLGLPEGAMVYTVSVSNHEYFIIHVDLPVDKFLYIRRSDGAVFEDDPRK
jgi:hypothetical protein